MKLDPDTVELEEGFTRDTRGIGHYGTGELEVSIKTAENFQKAKDIIGNNGVSTDEIIKFVKSKKKEMLSLLSSYPSYFINVIENIESMKLFL